MVPGGMRVGRWLHRLVDPELRSVERLRRSGTGELFQPFATTSEDRYPQLFDALAERLAHLPSPRILSFGCSTGEEVSAMRQRMPHARIVGIDLNPRSIGIARRRDPNPLSDYRVASAPQDPDRFDAVLALAVFRHGLLESERPGDCAARLPFPRFAEGVAKLDAVLEPGGWFALWNAHFRFADAPAAAQYVRDPWSMQDQPPLQLLYGPDNRRLDGITEDAVLFRKSA